MSGIRLTISVTDNASGPLREFTLRVANTLPLMKNLGEIALQSVEENFEVGGRPKWQPLAPATIKAKGHSKPLIASGVLKNVVMRATANEVIVGVQPAAKEYAAIQHFGGKAGRHQSVTIPARPFMLLQPEVLEEIDQLVQGWPSEALKT
jgi:phage virion morphogenesis protein